MKPSDILSCISGDFTTRARAAGDWGASLQQIHCPAIQRQYESLPRAEVPIRKESRQPHFLPVYPRSRTRALYYSSSFAKSPDWGKSRCSPCIAGHPEAGLESHTALPPLEEAQQIVSLLPCSLSKEVYLYLFQITEKVIAALCHLMTVNTSPHRLFSPVLCFQEVGEAEAINQIVPLFVFHFCFTVD